MKHREQNIFFFRQRFYFTSVKGACITKLLRFSLLKGRRIIDAMADLQCVFCLLHVFCEHIKEFVCLLFVCEDIDWHFYLTFPFSVAGCMFHGRKFWMEFNWYELEKSHLRRTWAFQKQIWTVWLTRFQNYVWISSGVKEKNTSKPRYNTIITFLKKYLWRSQIRFAIYTNLLYRKWLSLMFQVFEWIAILLDQVIKFSRWKIRDITERCHTQKHASPMAKMLWPTGTGFWMFPICLPFLHNYSVSHFSFNVIC